MTRQALPYGAEEYLYIEDWIPVLDIPDIVLHTVFHIIERTGLAPAAIDLSPSGDSRLGKMAHHIVANQTIVHVSVVFHVRSRPYDRHVAFQYIDELWQFVDRASAQEVSELGLARVVLRGLQLVRIGIDFHRTEFVDHEALAVVACSLLLEIDRTGRRELGADIDKDKDERIDGAEEQEGEHDVEGTFVYLRYRVCHWLLVQTYQVDATHAADHHRAAGITVHRRHEEEVDEVLVAQSDDSAVLVRVS